MHPACCPRARRPHARLRENIDHRAVAPLQRHCLHQVNLRRTAALRASILGGTFTRKRAVNLVGVEPRSWLGDALVDALTDLPPHAYPVVRGSAVARVVSAASSASGTRPHRAAQRARVRPHARRGGGKAGARQIAHEPHGGPEAVRRARHSQRSSQRGLRRGGGHLGVLPSPGMDMFTSR